MLRFADYKNKISKSVHYHVEHDIPFAENIYRLHSEEFYKLFREARELYDKGVLLELDDWDKDLLETDIGEFGFYDGTDIRLSYEDSGKNVFGTYVDESFFAFSGTTAILGRTLQKADMEAGASPVAVISSHIWKNDYII